MSAGSTEPTSDAGSKDFWSDIGQLPPHAQQAFADASFSISANLGENLQSATDIGDKDRSNNEQSRAANSTDSSPTTTSASSQSSNEQPHNLNDGPTIGHKIAERIICTIPSLNQIGDVRDIVIHCLAMQSDAARADPERWVALAISCFGLSPEIGSAVKMIGKVGIQKDARLLDLLKQMEWVEQNSERFKMGCPWGFAPIAWLRSFDWVGYGRGSAGYAKQAFGAALTKTEAVLPETSGLVNARLSKLVETFKLAGTKIDDATEQLANRIKKKVDELLRDAKKNVNSYEASPGETNQHPQRDLDPRPIACCHFFKRRLGAELPSSQVKEAAESAGRGVSAAIRTVRESGNLGREPPTPAPEPEPPEEEQILSKREPTPEKKLHAETLVDRLEAQGAIMLGLSKDDPVRETLAKMRKDLRTIAATNEGEALLNQILLICSQSSSGIWIYTLKDAQTIARGGPGAHEAGVWGDTKIGSAIIYYTPDILVDPDFFTIPPSPGTYYPNQESPSDILLFHELVHALHTIDTGVESNLAAVDPMFAPNMEEEKTTLRENLYRKDRGFAGRLHYWHLP